MISSLSLMSTRGFDYPLAFFLRYGSSNLPDLAGLLMDGVILRMLYNYSLERYKDS